MKTWYRILAIGARSVGPRPRQRFQKTGWTTITQFIRTALNWIPTRYSLHVATREYFVRGCMTNHIDFNRVSIHADGGYTAKQTRTDY
jgi:cobalamin biosynthesis protein CobD/CbiB